MEGGRQIMIFQLEAGDTVEFVQKDGEIIHIHVAENALVIKANVPGTHLNINRDSVFCVAAKTVVNKSPVLASPPSWKRQPLKRIIL